MNSHVINSVDGLLPMIFRISWHASVVVILVLVVQWALRRRMPARWHYLLWLLVVARLLMPVAPESGVSVFNWVPIDRFAVYIEGANLPENTATVALNDDGSAETDLVAVEPELLPNGQIEIGDSGIPTLVVPTEESRFDTGQTLQPNHLEPPPKAEALPPAAQPIGETTVKPIPPQTRIGWPSFFAVTWIVGITFFAIRVVAAQIRLNRLLATYEPVDDSNVLRLLSSCCHEMGIRKTPRLLLVNENRSPAVVGFFDPLLLISQNHLQSFSDRELRYIFLHELAHIRRRDLAVHWLINVMRIVHWFNPLIWFASYRMQVDRELACDELVLSTIPPSENQAYGRTIVKLLESFTSQPHSIGVASMADARHMIRWRIVEIARFQRPSVWQTGLAIAVLVVIGGIGLTSAVSSEPKTNDIETERDRTTDKSDTQLESDRSLTTSATAALSKRAITGTEPTSFHQQPSTLRPTANEIHSMDFSSDGKWLLTAGGRWDLPGHLRLWDAKTKRLVAQLREPRGLTTAKFSPDGKRFATIGYDRVVKIRDTLTREVVCEFDCYATSRLAYSPDGKMIATGGEGSFVHGAYTGFEVRLWDAETGQRLANIPGDRFNKYCISFSPDGKTIAAGGYDVQTRKGKAAIFDVQSRTQVKVLEGHSQIVYCVDFSPNGEFLVTGCLDRKARLFDASGNPLAALLQHSYGLSHVRFSRDSSMLAACSYDGYVTLWDTSQKAVSQITRLGPHMGGSRAAAFSTDGKLLATSGNGNDIRFWNTTTRQQIDQARVGDDSDENEAIVSVAYSADGSTIAVATEGKAVKLIDAISGEVRSELRQFDEVVSEVAFSPDGATLATASFDKSVKLWSVASGKLLARLEGHSNWVSCVAFSPDGRFLASGGYDKSVRLWDVNSKVELTRLNGHTSAIRSVTFSVDGKLLASGSGDKTVRIWSVQSQKQHSVLKGHDGSVRSIAFGPDGKLLASGSEDKTVKLWNVGQAGSSLYRTLEGHTDMVSHLAFSPLGRTLASCGFDNTIHLWNPEDGSKRQTLRGHQDVVTSLAFAPDTSMLVSGGYDRVLRVWKADASRVPPIATLDNESKQTRVVVFSPSGRKFAVAGDRHTEIRDVTTGKTLWKLEGHTGNVTCAAASPAGQMIATAGEDKSIRLWNSETGEQLGTLTGHEDAIRTINFSHDGKRLASGGADRTVRIWDVAERSEIETLPKQSLPISVVVFSPGGTLLATATGNPKKPNTPGNIKLWDAKTFKPAGELSGHRGEIMGLAFSRNGILMASCGADKQLILWHTQQRRQMNAWGSAADAAITSTVFSRAGNHLVCADGRGGVHILDIRSRQRIARYTGHKAPVLSLNTSRDGTLLASVDRDGVVKFWPLERGAITERVRAGLSVQQVAVSPDGRRFIASTGNRIAVRESTGQLTQRLSGHTAEVFDLAVSHDGTKGLSASADHSVLLWDLRTGEQLGQLEGHTAPVRTVTFLAVGRALSAGLDRQIILWDLETGKELRRFAGHTSAIHDIAASSDGTIGASCDGNDVRVWDLESGKLRRKLNSSAGARRLVFLPKSNRLLTTHEDMSIRLWDVNMPDSVRRFEGHTGQINALAVYSTNETNFISGGEDRDLLMWSITKSQPIYRIGSHNAPITSIAVSQTRQLVSADQAGTILLWNLSRLNATAADGLVRQWPIRNLHNAENR